MIKVNSFFDHPSKGNFPKLKTGPNLNVILLFNLKNFQR